MTHDEPNLEHLARTFTNVALSFVAAAVLVTSWEYITNGQAPYGDDNSAHLALMNHIAELWRAGTFELWWDQSNLGLPLFAAYQPLPALVGGTISSAFASFSARLVVFKGSIVLLWALMPGAWYLGARWMGLDRGEALIAGLLTLAVRDVHDVGFGFTSATYGGLYTQTWGMFFLPATVGAFRRFVVDRDIPLVTPVALFVLVSLSHLWCGMFAGIATLGWLVASSEERRARVVRALKIYAPALALLAFWLGPMVATGYLIGGLPWKSEYYDGWPVAELFGHVLGGDVFDAGRIPWLSVLAVVGVVFAAQRTSRTVNRWLLATLAVSLVLFMGRTNFGAFYDLIPMHAHINVMRYINAVQFCGIFLAAIGLWRLFYKGWGLRNIIRRRSESGDSENTESEGAKGIESTITRRFSGHSLAIFGLVLGLAAAAGYSIDRARAFDDTLRTFDHRDAEFQALVDYLAPPDDPTRIPSRIVVTEALNTAPHIYRDLLPALAGRGQVQSYALGYHATLSTYYADYTRYDPRWARLFGAGYFVAREPHRDSMLGGFDRLFASGPYSVWRPGALEHAGYFDFVTTPARVHGGYREVRPAVRRILVPGFEARALPVLTGPDEVSTEAGAPVLTADSGVSLVWSGDNPDAWIDALSANAHPEVASRVLASRRGSNWYEADVDASGDERLMLKANYFPFWEATVDGAQVDIEHLVPNFMVVDVPEGRHTVRFIFRNPWWQKLGALLCVLVLLGWGAWTHRRSRRD